LRKAQESFGDGAQGKGQESIRQREVVTPGSAVRSSRGGGAVPPEQKK